MPRFFVSSANFDGDTVRITGDDARHIARALRMAVGETVTVQLIEVGTLLAISRYTVEKK